MYFSDFVLYEEQPNSVIRNRLLAVRTPTYNHFNQITDHPMSITPHSRNRKEPLKDLTKKLLERFEPPEHPSQNFFKITPRSRLHKIKRINHDPRKIHPKLNYSSQSPLNINPQSKVASRDSFTKAFNKFSTGFTQSNSQYKHQPLMIKQNIQSTPNELTKSRVYKRSNASSSVQRIHSKTQNTKYQRFSFEQIETEMKLNPHKFKSYAMVQTPDRYHRRSSVYQDHNYEIKPW